MKITQPSREFLDFIQSGSKFILAGHKDPDGDCVGSQLALVSALKRLGKEAIAVQAGPFMGKELSGWARLFDNDPQVEHDARVILCDCADFERTGAVEDAISGLKAAMIDHHEGAITGSGRPGARFEAAYVDSRSPATTVLALTLIEALGLTPNAWETELLFFGLCTDTGFFRHVGKGQSAAFQAAARLCELGANPKRAYAQITGGKSFQSRVFAGRVLSGAKSYYGGRFIIVRESPQDFSKFGKENRDSDAIYQLLQAVDGVELVAFIKKEAQGKCVVGLRSTDRVNVAEAAAILGGGGHKNAAGFTVDEDATVIETRLVDMFRRQFEESAG
jgi:phosphoesterase RecJ-like protein